MGKGAFAHINSISLLSAPANAEACPSIVSELRSFLMGTVSEFEDILQTFNPPPEVVQAKVEVKQCIDGISLEDRLKIQNLLVNSLFFLRRGFCSVHSQEGGGHLLCEGTGGRGSCPLLTSERVTSGHRVDENMTPAEMYLGCTQRLGMIPFPGSPPWAPGSPSVLRGTTTRGPCSHAGGPETLPPCPGAVGGRAPSPSGTITGESHGECWEC